MLNKNNEESRIDYNFYEVFVSSLLRRLGIDREKFKNDIRTIYGEDSFKHFCYAIYCKVPYGG